MMRTVVHFVDSPIFGGTEQTLLHLLAGLDRRRWQPVLFHHGAPGIAPLVEGARRLEVKTMVVPPMKGRQTIGGLPIFWQRLRAEGPAIFHAHLSWLLACKYGLLAASLARVPVVIATAQQYMQPPWGRTVYAQQQLFGAGVHRYVAVSEVVAQQLNQTFHVPVKKICVIHNSVPGAAFNRSPNLALRIRLTRGVERPMVLTIARLDKQKGYTHLLEAISQIREAIFIFAGDGPERTALESQAQMLGVAERVIFLGYRQDIADLLASCDLFVLPSIYEGLPLSVLEAMAAGKPVVATAVGGTPEAVTHGETGLLVPPADPPALAQAIQRVLSNPALARSMGEAGQARVRQQFSVECMVQRITQVYEELLGRQRDTG